MSIQELEKSMLGRQPAADVQRPGTVRIFIIDDDPVFRAGLRATASENAAIDVVGEAGSAGEAAPSLDRLASGIDVVLMNFHRDDRSAIDFIKTATGVGSSAPRTPVLVLSAGRDDVTVVAALRAGACGYLVKGTSQQDLIRDLCVVAGGGAVFSPCIAERLRTLIGAAGTSAACLPNLTDRERQVLDLLARGHSNRRIAYELVLSDKTVRNYVSQVLAKLQVSDRAEAILHAKSAGLGQESVKQPGLT